MSGHSALQPLYLNPPWVISEPGPEYRSSTRRFQGIPSLARSPGGRLWAIWYGGQGTREDHFNYAMLATSGDDGHTWSDVKLIIDPDGDGPVRAFDPQLWVDPDGCLWAFWAQTIGHEGTIAGVWALTTNDPDSADPEWTAPRRLTDGVMMGKPLVLSSGEWVLPASTWRETDDSAKAVFSADCGQTWQLRGACQVPEEARSFDEHMIVEREDRTLWMLVRTTYGLGESTSTDRGRTWSPLKPSPIQHPTARFFIRRLGSGRLLLVKHGPIDERTDRKDLRAFLSQDEGQTWHGGLLLDGRAGVSYPDGVQAPEGTIYVIYDYSRTGAREILLSRFTEQDVANGQCVSGIAELHMLVNKATADAQGPPVTQLAFVRGEWQIARFYSVLMRPKAAVQHAKRCLATCAQNEVTGCDIAFAYEAMARAYAVATGPDKSSKYAGLAERAAQEIEEEGNRGHLLNELSNIADPVNWPAYSGRLKDWTAMQAVGGRAMGEKGSKLAQKATTVCEQVVRDLAPLGDVTERKMFGGYGIFESAAMFALISAQGEVYLKVDDSNRARFEGAGAERHGRMPYFQVPMDVLEDADLLREWGRDSITIAHASKKK